MDEFYDENGFLWRPYTDGRYIVREKSLDKSPRMKAVPGELGFFAHVDGCVYTSWENRDGTPGRNKQKHDHMTRVPVENSNVNLYNRVMPLAETILLTFIGPRTIGYVVKFVDENSNNYALLNLKWVPDPNTPHARLYRDLIEQMRTAGVEVNDTMTEEEILALARDTMENQQKQLESENGA